MRNLNEVLLYYSKNVGESEVDITITKPIERVVFYKELDFNPFKTLFNGLEMIAMLKPSQIKQSLKTGEAVVFEDSYCKAVVRINYGLQMTVHTNRLDSMSEEHMRLSVGLMMVQEYLAELLDEDLGAYTHVSSKLSDKSVGLKALRCPYAMPGIYARVLVNNRSKFFKEVKAFNDGEVVNYQNTFILEVAIPMREAYELYESGELEKAMVHVAKEVWSADWKLAATEWLHRRIVERKIDG